MRLLVVLDIEDGQATVVHSKPLVQNTKEVQQALNLNDELDVVGKFSI